MEKIIAEKMEQQHHHEHLDAFDYMLSSAREHGHSLTIQELKVAASGLTLALQRLRRTPQTFFRNGFKT